MKTSKQLSTWCNQKPHDDHTSCYVFYTDTLLASSEKNQSKHLTLTWGLLKKNMPTTEKSAWLIQTHQGQFIYVVDLEEPHAIEGYALEPLKAIYTSSEPLIAAQVSQAYQLVYFNRTHQFCGCCGEALKHCINEWAKKCERCEHVFYPHLSPVVMILIHHGDKMLLARGPHFPPDRHSVLAGFVEPGETLEAAAAREVKEEVGLEIKNLRYFSSQSWPFPHSLMVAFYAEYTGGEIKVDGQEIEHAAWFDKDNPPPLPPSNSISNQLINSFIN